MMVKYEEHPYRITEKDPNARFIAPTTVVAGQEFDIYEFQSPVEESYLFSVGDQIYSELRTTETGNPEIPLTTTVKLVKTDPTRTFRRVEVATAPYAMWRELIDVLRKLYQGEDWKLEQMNKVVISYIPIAAAHVISSAHSRFMLECIRVTRVLTL